MNISSLDIKYFCSETCEMENIEVVKEEECKFSFCAASLKICLFVFFCTNVDSYPCKQNSLMS